VYDPECVRLLGVYSLWQGWRPLALTGINRPAAAALTGLLGAATLIGGVAAAVTFLPRLNVNPGGDFSNPASIQFGITNTNFVPLRRPSYGIVACEIVYGIDNPSLRKPETPCNISRIQKMPTPERGQRWLEMDDTYTLRLEDMFRVESLPITRANLIVMISYCPFYLPWRLQKLFGFRTAQGSDGKLYWRSYPVD
jgi:hypothetical protein